VSLFAERPLLLPGAAPGEQEHSASSWCRVSESNGRPTAYRTTSAFAASRSWSGLSLSRGMFTCYRLPPSSLYTFPLPQAWLGIGTTRKGASFPRI
jgi:hypothetical protein